MGIPEAVHLILKAGAQAKGGEIFILKMQATNIMDLAEVMIENLAENYNRKREDIGIEITGKKLEKKCTEEAHDSPDKSIYAIDKGELFILNSKISWKYK